ncbi:phosphoribosylamine--glycine ligase [Candidatus Falkowbacteria bacterium RBG_13_39_14]|uniref:Phosphoribosylamine--glycine ligase n=1 Tax=Candidatus Falkowbacteria bacterium RBG_13_39_14 TaxID=1797985 RepID=A0A1F5S723_9BACT|nr:MAG: phosphoribosylamine--glycine ligase [Candidatus Falkowbacteria bacterium RBG_13_39_14]
MKVLIIGGGGREHAIGWQIDNTSKGAGEKIKLFAIPGNAGIAQIAECYPCLDVANFPDLANFAKEKEIDNIIVGPEYPLSIGIVDALSAHGLHVFGPTAEAAQIESSKFFVKRLMKKKGIPTADYDVAYNLDEAIGFVKNRGYHCAIKADKLCNGKGVFICKGEDSKEAADLFIRFIRMIFETRIGPAIIEDLLIGEEASFMAFVDKNGFILPMEPSKDHKHLLDGDNGPMTGGMGAISPTPIITREMHDKIMKKIMHPIVEAMREQGINYTGILYAGLMIVENEPLVLEFNARFGDPETQPLMVRLETPLLEITRKSLQGRLHEVKLDWDKRSAACVVLCAEGYPGKPILGTPISSDDLYLASDIPGLEVFHAGTTRDEQDRIVTSGGRVLGVTALDNYLECSITKAYKLIGTILKFEGMQYRKDIGLHVQEFLKTRMKNFTA